MNNQRNNNNRRFNDGNEDDGNADNYPQRQAVRNNNQRNQGGGGQRGGNNNNQRQGGQNRQGQRQNNNRGGQRQQQQNRQPVERAERQPLGPTAPTLPGPSNTHVVQKPTATKDELLWKESIFGQNITVREINRRKTFTPNCVGLIPVATETWRQLMVDNTNIHKEMIPEAVRYYAACLLWSRIATLKRANSQPLTEAEEALLQMIDTVTFSVPTPIFLYLAALGSIKDQGSGQNLYPEFPAMPVEAVGGIPGMFGPVDEATHNLYEEFPALGVCAEALQQAVGDAPAGPYASVLALPNVPVNQNLCGYVPLVGRRNEAKQMAMTYGITADFINETIQATAFNYDFMFAMSNWFSTNKSFSVEEVNFPKMGLKGSQSLLICEEPMPSPSHLVRNIDGDVRAYTNQEVSPGVFGVAMFGAYQQDKLSAEEQGQNISINAQVWSCLSFTGAEGLVIPDAWIENMNERRNLPVEFMQARFDVVSQRASHLRADIVKSLVIAKR